MKPLAIARLMTIGVVAIAIPGIACLGYYNLEDYGDVSGGMSTLIVLAYPAALVGVLWLGMAMLATKYRKRHVLLAGSLLIAPVIFLLLLRA